MGGVAAEFFTTLYEEGVTEVGMEKGVEEEAETEMTETAPKETMETDLPDMSHW